MEDFPTPPFFSFPTSSPPPLELEFAELHLLSKAISILSRSARVTHVMITDMTYSHLTWRVTLARSGSSLCASSTGLLASHVIRSPFSKREATKEMRLCVSYVWSS